MTKARRSGALRGGFLVLFLLCWQLAAGWLDDPLLPSPAQVAATLWQEVHAGELLPHLGITLLRVLAAFLIAFVVGSGIGILMGRSSRLDAALDGLLVIGLNIPALVTIILCYIWFGLTETAAVIAVSVNKIPTTVVTLREGARAVDQALLDVARVFRLPTPIMLRRVYLPQLYPYFMAAARNGLALIWKIVLVVELLGRSDGIGYQLGIYFQFFDIRGILAYIFAFDAVILLIESSLLRPLDRYHARWRP